MAHPEQLRTVLRLTGGDRTDFLQNLVTNDISQPGLHYAALLTPQGKYLADFFVLTRENDILIDVAEILGSALMTRLSMYRLRADVIITPSDEQVSCGTGTTPTIGYPDPRHTALGWRAYGAEVATGHIDWAALRVMHNIPETGIELGPDTFILEAGFERLNGVDFKKGCYVGQEVTARMKHKTELRKGIVQIQVQGEAAIGTSIIANEKPAGTLFTQSGGLGLAYLRFDRIAPDMTAGGAIVNA